MLAPHSMRSLVCRVLRRREDPGNWSAFPNVDDEVRDHLDSCEWYEVYDIIEATYERLAKSPPARHDGNGAEYFEREINKYFRRRGIGWKLSDGRIETRGSEGFERTLAEARAELAESGRATAANEIHQAISDLSRRPRPDVTGAIQHALAALECVAQVDAVPKDHGGDREVEARGTVALVLEGAVPDLAVTMEKQGAGKRVSGLAFIEPGSPYYCSAEVASHRIFSNSSHIGRR
jgi:hypothetical protein